MIKLRIATTNEAADLTAISKITFDDDSKRFSPFKTGGPPGYDSVEFQKDMMDRCDYFCIYFENTLIGGLFYYKKEEASYHLVRIFILPEYQNRGIGREVFRMLDEMVADACKWELDTPGWAIRNHHFYESLGYKKVKEEYLENDGFSLYFYERCVTDQE